MVWIKKKKKKYNTLTNTLGERVVEQTMIFQSLEGEYGRRKEEQICDKSIKSLMNSL